MNKIKKLSSDLIPMIAAGEVVDSPVSVIKELLDNSLDAGSSKIVVELSNAGFDLIRIVDNGCGITESDLSVCFQPFYTSKLSNVADLHHITTLGFRGEALSSICAVSTVIIKSRTADASYGTTIEIQDGHLIKTTQSGLNVGTIVEVHGLFSNIPARRKFFKNEKNEFQKILSVFMAYMIGHPLVGFKLSHNGNLIINASPQELLPRIKEVLDSNTVNALIPLTVEDARFKLTGFISKPHRAEVTGSSQYLYINQRFIADKLIPRKIKEAYKNLIPHDVYPPFVLFMEISPDLIDVNVHPKKEKVAFWDESYVLETLFNAIQDALSHADLTYTLGEDLKNYHYDKSAVKDTFTSLKDSSPIWRPKPTTPKDYSLCFQIGATYIATPLKEGLLLVDQHAAHESILYDAISKDYKDKKTSGRQVTLDEPYELSLTLHEKNILGQYLSEFTNYGFSIEQFGTDDYRLVALPSYLKDSDKNALVKEALSDITLTGKMKDMDLKTQRTIAFLACRSAVKAGDILSQEEQKNILNKLDECSSLYTCPHGRPIKIIVKNSELAKLFKRIK